MLAEPVAYPNGGYGSPNRGQMNQWHFDQSPSSSTGFSGSLDYRPPSRFDSPGQAYPSQYPVEARRFQMPSLQLQKVTGEAPEPVAPPEEYVAPPVACAAPVARSMASPGYEAAETQQLKQQVQQLESRLLALEMSSRALYERNARLEAESAELRSRVQTLETAGARYAPTAQPDSPPAVGMRGGYKGLAPSNLDASFRSTCSGGSSNGSIASSIETHIASEPPVESLLKSASPPEGKPGTAVSKGFADKESEKQRLADGVFLIKNFDRQDASYECLVENKKLSKLQFTLDISGSQNVAFRNGANVKSNTSCTVIVPPSSTVSMCVAGAVDKRKSYRLAMSCGWVPQTPSKEEVKAFTAEEERRRKQLANKLTASGIVASKLGDASSITEACRNLGIDRFIDAEFFPDDHALFQDPASSDGPPIIWKRPSEFMSGHINVITGGVKPSDIQQGALGDCWFLAALAAVGEFPERIEALFGGCTYNELGVYEVHCFKDGRPTVVVLDDLFPCSPSTGKPCYAHTDSDNNELWVLLLEKAWAKLYGSYEQIEAGMPYRAVMDLLGASGKEIIFEREEKPGGLIANGLLFQTLSEYDRKGFVMTAATPGEDNLTKAQDIKPTAGLVPGHAYTLLEVKEACGHRLLRLRNPWGDFEWGGDWSDQSPLWTQKLRDEFRISSDEHDGEFWMSEEDFLRHFTAVGIVFHSDSWAEQRLMLKTTASEICMQAVDLQVHGRASGFFCLLQQDSRIVGAKPYAKLAFALYGPCGPSGMPEREILRSELWPVRELVEEVKAPALLEPGRYIIVIFNPAKEADRDLTLLIQLDENGVDAGMNSHIATLRTVDEELRRGILLASAVGSKKSSKGKLGPLETFGCFMPHQGYTLAARPSTGSPSVEFDFSACKGLKLRDGTMKAKCSSWTPGSPTLVAELLPIPAGGKMAFSYSASWSG